MHSNLLNILKRLSEYDPHLLIDSVELFEADQRRPAARVAVLRLAMGPVVNVSLLLDTEASQSVVDGLCAHHRLHKEQGGAWVSELVVLPGLDVTQPILLGTHTALTGLDAPVIRVALLSLSHC